MCLFTGRLGRDPEVRYAPSGDAVVNISIAVSKKWKDKQSGETKEQTTWVPINFWGKSAELIGKYCQKGSQIRVTGEFSVRKYQKDGVDHYATDIKGQDFQLLGGKPDGAQGGQQQQAPAPRPAPKQSNDDDSDIPF